MAFGPVFRHEMLAAGRKRRFFAAAFGVGLGMLVLLWMCRASAWYVDDGEMSIAATAQLTATFYAAFIWATLIGVLVVTPLVVAGAIASERERRTIEYLFATDLSNGEIVLDKLAARLLTVGRLVLAAVPVLAIFRLLGGVPGGLLLLHFAMIASTALVCAALALVVSVWCARARDAVPRAGGWVFLWLVSFPIAMAIGGGLAGSQDATRQWWGESVVVPAAMIWGIGNPVFVMTTAGGLFGREVGLDLTPETIAWMIGGHVVAAAALTAFATAMVRRVHLKAASSVVKAKRGGARFVRRRGPGDSRPMLWKEMHAASTRPERRRWVKLVGVLLLVGLIATPVALSLVYANRFDDYMQTAAFMAPLCGTLTLLAAGGRAAGLVCYEHERETWLSLLTTDLSASEIVLGKLWGNLWAVRWQMIGSVAIPLLGLWYSPAALVAALGFALALGLAVAAATAIGLAVSLRVKSSTKAVGMTIGILFAIGGVYPLIAMIVLASGGAGGQATVALFVVPPMAPFVMSLPTMAAAEWDFQEFMVVAFCAGVLLYAFVAFTTTLANINAFDMLCGRSTADNLGGAPSGLARLE